MQSDYDVIAIGAGNGGLSAAATTARGGKKTLVLERHNLPGGSATSFVRGRFEFESALHELCGLGTEERAVGVLMHGKKLYAKHIIANCSPSTVMGRMLPEYVKPPIKSVKLANARSIALELETMYVGLNRSAEEPAFFKAGSYLSVFLDVNGMKLTRPYSISSSPPEALDGKVTLTIKRVPGGIASNYMLDHWKVGDKVTLTGPLGEFVYLPIRDGSTVIGVAGGSGITPFHSFAKAIAEGDEGFNLVLLYGSRTEKDIRFKDEFDAIQKQTGKVKVVHVLRDEEKPGFEHGFITADLIRKYAPAENYSIFLCGPAGMYSFLDKQIETLHLEHRREADFDFGYIHPCCTFPLSDIAVEVPYAK